MLDLKYEPAIRADTSYMTDEVWKEHRRQGIGGSDVAAIFGVSPFGTARDLYYVKKGVKPVFEEEDNWVAKEVGHLLESLVAKVFTVKTGIEHYSVKKLFFHPNFPFMQANLDFMITLSNGKKGILECKTCNYNSKNKWDDGAVPFNYELQVRFYLAVMNLDFAYIACLYGNNEDEFVYQKIERDLDFEESIIEQVEYFWTNYVLAGVEPPYTESGDLVLASLKRYLGIANKNAPAVELQDNVLTTAKMYLDFKQEKSVLKDKIDLIETRMKTASSIIIQFLGNSCLGHGKLGDQEFFISNKPVTKRSIDYDKLEANEPDVYKAYVKESESYNRFDIKIKEAKL